MASHSDVPPAEEIESSPEIRDRLFAWLPSMAVKFSLYVSVSYTLPDPPDTILKFVYNPNDLSPYADIDIREAVRGAETEDGSFPLNGYAVSSLEIGLEEGEIIGFSSGVEPADMGEPAGVTHGQAFEQFFEEVPDVGSMYLFDAGREAYFLRILTSFEPPQVQ